MLRFVERSLNESLRNLIRRLRARIALDPKKFRVYSVLRFLVIMTAIRCVMTGNYQSFALCMLSLLLFLLPSLFEGTMKVCIPAGFQITIYIFIYAAEILGEVNKYFTAIPGWDTMLHTLNGFLCAAIGLSLVFILNKGVLHLSPIYLAIAAFCFSMTIGVMWEFFEFAADQCFYLDMQKDFVVTEFGSVSLDETKSQTSVHVKNITKTTIETEDGNTYVIEDGYLDIGIDDTMKDLLVNFLGASVFSIFGYFYESSEQKNSYMESMLIKPLTDEEAEAQEEKITEILAKKKITKSKKTKNQKKN